MSKVIIISDIHVNDYPRYNFSPGSRLNQFRKLTDRILEISKEHNCEHMFIAGDIIDKPVSRPHIVHEIKLMLSKFSKSFEKVYYILGQHDLDSKNDEHKLGSSVIHSIVPDNFIYADKTIINIENRSIAFMDWRAIQDLSWIQNKVDLFVGHVTVSNLFGQPIDNSKFKLGIVGDIHVHGKEQNLMKIGVPIQHSMNDQCEGTVIIYDTKTNKGEHVKVDNDHTRFLQMKYTNDKNEEGFLDDNLTYKIYRPNVAKGNKVSNELKNFSVEIDKLIDQYVVENELSEIHQEIKGSTKNIDTINFDF